MGGRYTRRAVLAASTSALTGATMLGTRADSYFFGIPPLWDRVQLGIVHDAGTVQTLETLLGYTFPVFGGAYFTFDTTWRRQAAVVAPARGRTLLLAWMPKSNRSGVLLSDIPKGRYDAHIDQMLVGMRGFGGPVVCRFGYEMNGNWMPWSQAYPGSPCTTLDFIAAWRYIVSRERRMPGTSNVRWLWCASGLDLPSPHTGEVYTLEDYWPGGEWVDLVGCDVYNEPGRWESFDAVLAEPYQRITALSDSAFWVAEIGCHEPSSIVRTSKAQWIADMLNSRRFPQLAVVCYFDYDARSKGRSDWRFNSTASTFRAVQRIFRDLPAATP